MTERIGATKERDNVSAARLPPTALLGREREAADVADLLLRDDVRVVTLAGPGGVGKTRLAVQVGQTLREHFADGVAFVDLAPVRDPGLVLPTIRRALGLAESEGDSPAAVVEAYLRDRQLLLLLDNFEQVIEASPAVAAPRAVCAGVRVLATSRVALRLRGERVYPLPPLALPDLACLPAPDTLGRTASVALFVQQARSAHPTFALTPANAAAVAGICHRVDGLPLAIELAAAWAGATPPAVISAAVASTPRGESRRERKRFTNEPSMVSRHVSHDETYHGVLVIGTGPERGRINAMIPRAFLGGGRLGSRADRSSWMASGIAGLRPGRRTRVSRPSVAPQCPCAAIGGPSREAVAGFPPLQTNHSETTLVRRIGGGAVARVARPVVGRRRRGIVGPALAIVGRLAVDPPIA